MVNKIFKSNNKPILIRFLPAKEGIMISVKLVIAVFS
jgi:hypothetical protein